MKAGKLPLELLSNLLSEIKVKDPRVILGAKTGEDAAVIDIGDRFLVAKMDPITFATDEIGWYLVQINSNDLFVMGATPKWLMATLLFPETYSKTLIKNIFNQLSKACEEANITLIGGHTEITYGLDRPLAIGAILGEVNKNHVIYTSDANIGDEIVITKGIAIEGTAIIAREKEAHLLSLGVNKKYINNAKNFIFEPGISIKNDSKIAINSGNITSMHDPTEGGLFGALQEIAKAANVGLHIEENEIYILPECLEICSKIDINPFGMIASGSLLCTVKAGSSNKLIDNLRDAGSYGYKIGKIMPKEYGIMLSNSKGVKKMPIFKRDEIARYLSQ
ncbi:MAG: hydrogenase expression/formation protein [Chloroflexi bacterium]|nr:hydrogenase expression/formation protein [Chloroflexota bacterium]